MPFVPLFPGQEYTDEIFQKVRQLCIDYDSNEVIARTTTRGDSDFRGLVDVTPTSSSHFNDHEETVQRVREAADNPAIYEYAAKEGLPYDGKNVLVALAPKIRGNKWTFTEHPNREETMLIDVYDDSQSYTDTEMHNFVHGKNINKRTTFHDHKLASKEQVEQMLLLRNWLRETGLFDDDRSFQLEGVFHPRTKTPILTQVRDFAERKEADYEIENDSIVLPVLRNFGITSQEGIILPVVSKLYRTESLVEGDKTKVPYILAPKGITNPLTLRDYSEHMRGYMPLHPKSAYSSLAHQNTRFIKTSLERGGFSIIDKTGFLQISELTEIKDGDVVKVIMDSRGLIVEILS